MMKLKEPFSFTTSKNEVLELALLRPNSTILQKARNDHSKAFGDALKAGAPLRATLDKYVREQGMWDDTKEEEYQALRQAIQKGEKSLGEGGIKLSEARQIALEMRQAREELRELLSDRTALDGHTAEGQADNVRFNSLISQCLVYNDTGKAFFESLEDYISRAIEPVSITAANKFAAIYYGLDEDFRHDLPESKFLKKWKFIDEKLRLINPQGQLVDEVGRLVDEDGRWVNEDGKYVDNEGNTVDEIGNLVVEEPQPFLDDEGNPLSD